MMGGVLGYSTFPGQPTQRPIPPAQFPNHESSNVWPGPISMVVDMDNLPPVPIAMASPSTDDPHGTTMALPLETQGGRCLRLQPAFGQELEQPSRHSFVSRKSTQRNQVSSLVVCNNEPWCPVAAMNPQVYRKKNRSCCWTEFKNPSAFTYVVIRHGRHLGRRQPANSPYIDFIFRDTPRME